jgi:hypothetical protein
VIAATAPLAHSQGCVEPPEERLGRHLGDPDHQVVMVDQQRPTVQLDVGRDEDPPYPLDEEPPVVVGREDRPALVAAPDDAEDVAGRPDALSSRHPQEDCREGTKVAATKRGS